MNLRTAVLTAAVAVAATIPCRADLVNTPVTGVLNFGTGTTNYYDPAVFGGIFVDGLGDLNSAGSTVTISSSGTEFGFSAGGTTITANFTGTQLTITEIASSPSGWTQTFTDPAFAGATLVSNSFVGLSYPNGPSTGDQLVFSWAGAGATSQPTTYSATFNVIDPALPEPSNLNSLVMGLGAIALFSLGRRRWFRNGPA